MKKIKNYLALASTLNFSKVVNLFMNKIESRLGRTKLLSRPYRIDIVPTKRCNIRCIFCIKYPTKGSHDLTLPRFEELARKLFKTTLCVAFCSGGEPFLNENMREYLKICKKYRNAVIMVTNGSLLDEELCRFLIQETTLYKLNISFDGATREMVEKIRRGLDYDRVVKNIQKLCELKKQAKKSWPLIILRFAAMKQNVHELPLLVEKAAGWGVDEIQVDYLNVTNDIPRDESLFFHRELMDKYFSQAAALARQRGINLCLPQPLADKGGKAKCREPWEFMMIDTDGRERFCYKAWENPQDSLFEKPVSRIWNSEKYQKIRASVNTDKTYFNYCSICSSTRGMSQLTSHLHKPSEEKNYYSFNE